MQRHIVNISDDRNFTNAQWGNLDITIDDLLIETGIKSVKWLGQDKIEKEFRSFLEEIIID